MKIYHYNTIKVIRNDDKIKEVVTGSYVCDIPFGQDKMNEIIEELKIKHNCDIIDVAVTKNDKFKL